MAARSIGGKTRHSTAAALSANPDVMVQKADVLGSLTMVRLTIFIRPSIT